MHRLLFFFRCRSFLCGLRTCAACAGMFLLACDPVQYEEKVWHPLWFALNADETQPPADQCVVTKMGWEAIRFRPGRTQLCLTSEAFRTDRKKIRETIPTATYLVFTPSFYGALSQKHFPRTLQAGIRYKNGGKTGGLPEPFLEELLALEDARDSILILATGMKGRLGIDEALEMALKQKKEAGEIQDYKIRTTIPAVEYHNRLVQAGKRVHTFLHTAG